MLKFSGYILATIALMLAAGLSGMHIGRDDMRSTIANACKVGGGFVAKQSYYQCKRTKNETNATD